MLTTGLVSKFTPHLTPNKARVLRALVVAVVGVALLADEVSVMRILLVVEVAKLLREI